MPYIVEILVVIDAPTPYEAERYGGQLVSAIEKKALRSVKNVIVSDVRPADD